MRSPLSSLHIVFAIAFAILCGAATYLLVIWIASPPSERAAAVTERTGVLESQLKSPDSGPPLVWGLKTSDLTVGDSGQITLKVEVVAGAGAELPTDLAASAETTSRGILLSGPNVEGSQAGHIWTWQVTAENPGPHEVIVSVDSADGAYQKTFRETLAARESQNIMLRLIATGNTLLNAVAGTLATTIAILTSIGTIVAMSRKLKKPEPEPEAGPSSAGDDHLSADRADGAGRRVVEGRRRTRSRPKRPSDD